ncbi:MAG: cytochrome c oxidase assembly protein [Paracoccaceae bacterium]
MADAPSTGAPIRWQGAAAYGAIAVIGAALFFVSRDAPAAMPVWGPYDFSWPIYLTAALSLFWYLRGLFRMDAEDWPPLWRILSFFLGLLAIYAVVQTRFEYLAQHMFFLNRIQHVAMHHVGPVFLALSMCGPVILAGAPDWLRRVAGARPVGMVMAVVQQPVIATVLFVGLFYFWLIPPVHFVAMLDPLLYQVMNWTMAVDGILFWALVLDSRPCPPARLRFGIRAALAGIVMFPQILLGAVITFATTDIFPYYAFCGRLFPSVGPVADQQIGGIVIWIPPAMMSLIALLVVVGNMRRAER